MSFVAVGLGIAGGGSLLGGALASGGAKDAARTQADAATAAAQAQLQASQYQADKMLEAATQANNLQELMFLLGYDRQQPYHEVGTEALMTLRDLMQPGGYLTETAPQFDFDVSKVAQEPGYDFALQEGLKAIQRAAASKGTLLSGGTLKDLQRFSTDYATSKVNDAFGRQLTEYGTNFNTEQANRTNLFNRLSSLAGTGQQAALAQANLGAGTGSDMAGTITNTAGNVANIGLAGVRSAQDFLTQAANARASGYVQGGNAWGNTLANLSQMPLQMITLQSLLKGGPISL